MTIICGNDQATQVRARFRNWIIYEDAYGITGRRRVDGIPETYTAQSWLVLWSHLANAEFRDVIAGVLARSA